MNSVNGALDQGIRQVTRDEVEFYREHGWVKLPGLVDPGVAADILSRIKKRMGDDARAQVEDGYAATTARPPQVRAMFNNYELPSRDDSVLRDFVLSQGIGRAAAALSGMRMRYWSDICLVKMPATQAGGITPWHQDWPYYPQDRSGSMNLWLALVDVPAERGSLRFVEGSHSWGPLGRIIGRPDGKDQVDLLPEFLREKVKISPPLDLQPGDVTVHNELTIHSAAVNTTNEARWAYTITAFPADTLFTGSANRRTDGLGLKVNQPYDHPNFPVLPV